MRTPVLLPSARRVVSRLVSYLPFFRSGLRFKLLSIVMGITFFGVLLSSFVVLMVQRQQLVDSAQSSSARLSSAIQASLRYAMIRNDWAMISQSIWTITGEKGSDRIRILDTGGTVRVSSLPVEVGNHLERTSPTCVSCHPTGGLRGNQQRMVTSSYGTEMMVSVNLIHNQSECYGCHDSRTDVLGLLMIETPLTDLNHQLTMSFLLMTLTALLSFVFLVGMMMPALRHLILYPIGELTLGVAAIRAGDLDRPVSVTGGDELGDLAHAFDAMRVQLNASRGEMERRNRELGILNELALDSTQWRNFEDIPARALETVLDKTDLGAGAIFLFDAATGRDELAAVRGFSPSQVENLRQIESLTDTKPTGPAVEGDTTAFAPDISADRRFDGVYHDSQMRSYIRLSLSSQSSSFGYLSLFSRPGQPLIERDVQVLRAMAHEISLAMENALLLAEAHRREHETITLYRLMMKVSASLELDQVLDAIAQGARQILSADIGLFAILDDDRRQMVVKACSGSRTALLQNLAIPISEAERQIGPLGRSIVTEHWTPELAVPHVAELIREEGITSSLAVPMWRNGQLYAYIAVMTREHRQFSQEEIQLFLRLVLQVAVAIENAELYRQVRYLATLEERDRLARELHDNLAQKLGYLNVKASITDSWLNKNAISEARSSLLELKQIIQEAYTDVREGIFNLRMTVSARHGLVETLQEYLNKYTEHYGVQAELSVVDRFEAPLTADAEIQITRIVQEALMNVRKHAGTCQAFVRLARQDHHVQVIIEDEGRGFDLHEITLPGDSHFGLQIMRERAESIGGRLEIQSEPGQGTRIALSVPLAIQD